MNAKYIVIIFFEHRFISLRHLRLLVLSYCLCFQCKGFFLFPISFVVGFQVFYCFSFSINALFKIVKLMSNESASLELQISICRPIIFSEWLLRYLSILAISYLPLLNCRCVYLTTSFHHRCKPFAGLYMAWSIHLGIKIMHKSLGDILENLTTD
ncbi:hypothetical protein C5167_030706 [Papaver somniferum]|nr:hypothetical protein C5167_030706 [Papaver somniferum]